MLSGPRETRMVVLAWIMACAAPPERAPELTVFAAASLTDALPDVADAWVAGGGQPVSFTFDSSSKLAKQLASGQPADVFFSADAAWMDDVAGKGLIDPETRVDLLGNALVLVVPAGAPDVGLADVERLAMAGENVPAGRYGRAALRSQGAWDAVSPRVVSGDDVRTALGWVATGEADAGVVYATDARAEPRVRVASTFPAGSHPPIVYPAAVVTASDQREDAGHFLAFCASDAGMDLFRAAGFTAP